VRVVALARPEVAERRPVWAQDAGVHRVLALATLTGDDGTALADALLARIESPPEALRRLLVERAQGNPFFMEELLRMLIDEGAIEAGPERWQLLPGRLQATRLPVTLTGVLQARIDRLQPRERLALQQAAVIGSRFWERALQALDADAVPALDRLQQRGLVHPAEDHEHKSTLGPAWVFAHQLQHQVAYETVLKRLRVGCHAQTARWLAAQPAATAHLAEIGEHFERAEDLDNAVDYRTRAAEDAVTRYAHDTVIEQVTRALALPTAGPSLRWRLLLARQRARRVQGDRAGQETDLGALEALAAEHGDLSWRATVALRRAVATQLGGDMQASEAKARAALAAAEAAGDEVSALNASSVLAATLRALGRHAAAREVAEACVARARVAGQPLVEAELLTVLSAIANDQGDTAGSIALLRQSLPIDRAIGNRLGEAAALINLGDAAYRQGQHAEAQDWLNQALRLTRALGFRNLEASALLNLAGVCHLRGDDAQALQHAQAACALADATANAEVGAFARLALGHARLGLADGAAARAAFVRAVELLQASGLAHLVVEAEAGLAEVALHEGDVLRALAHAEPVLTQQARDGHLDGTEHPLQLRWVCCRALRAAGDARAPAVLVGLQADLLDAAPAEAEARAEWLARVPYREAIAAAR
jgi:tetratricopeptide (TPR) repeat protein